MSQIPASILSKMDELKSSLRTLPRPVVGMDIKYVPNHRPSHSSAKLLILYAGTRCLITQLCSSGKYAEFLNSFLANETICFVGTGMRNMVDVLKLYAGNWLGGAELGHLAARILKKPNIERHGLQDLAGLVAVDIKQPIGQCPNWNATVFSHEEIKDAVHDARTYYVIGIIS